MRKRRVRKRRVMEKEDKGGRVRDLEDEEG